jgi:hypothetical protein
MVDIEAPGASSRALTRWRARRPRRLPAPDIPRSGAEIAARRQDQARYRSLLRDVARSRKADAIIAALLRMSRALDLDVLAEGLETAEQLKILRREKSAEFQGFHFGRPAANPFQGP